MLSDNTIKLIDKNKLNIKIYIVKQESINMIGESLGFKYFINLNHDYKFFVVEEIIHMCSSLRLTEKDENTREFAFGSVEACGSAIDYLVNDWLKSPVINKYSFEEMVYSNY